MMYIGGFTDMVSDSFDRAWKLLKEDSEAVSRAKEAFLKRLPGVEYRIVDGRTEITGGPQTVAEVMAMDEASFVAMLEKLSVDMTASHAYRDNAYLSLATYKQFSRQDELGGME